MSEVAGSTSGRPDPGAARRWAKRLAVSALRNVERTGVHVLPRHFYSPVADRAWLNEHGELWRRRAPMTGVRWDLDVQLAWLSEICSKHLHEVAGFSFLPSIERSGIPFRYGLIEAQVLHAFIRSAQPSRIVEVGSGASTALMAEAARMNGADGGPVPEILSVDPYAVEGVRALEGVEVIKAGALEVSPDVFGSLGAGDLLFIDSSHAVKTGSELSRLYLDIIPGLRPGVVIHIHDTYLPRLYSPWVLEDLWDWQETTLLLGLLTNNACLDVLCAQSALHDARQQELRAILPDYVPLPLDDGISSPGAQGHFPSSTWLRAG